MSDPDAMPDPVDKAYVEAEAVLSDEAARTARRARVLAAVARQDEPDAAPSAARPHLWRRGGWLVAACVSALALVVAVEVYRPSAYPPPPIRPTATPAAPATPTNEAAAAATRPAPAPVPALVPAPPLEAPQRAAKSEPERPPVDLAPSPAPPPAAQSAAGFGLSPAPSDEAAPPPPPPAGASSARAAPAKPANPQQAANAGVDDRTQVTQMVVTGEKRESRGQSAPAAISAFAARGRDVVDAGARLRTAAAAGRNTDLEALLEQGAPVDSPDAHGDTALMKSIEADHPAAAALLRRYGASLDQTNHAGESARDMAKAKADAELNQAIGLSP